MPGRGRPPKKGISPKGVPLANRQSRLQSQSPIASRNGDIRSMFSRQAAKKNKSPPPPDADAASPAPVAKRARRDATPEAFVDGVLKRERIKSDDILQSLLRQEDGETPEDDEPLRKSPKKEPRSTPKSATKQGSRVLADLTNGKKDKCEKSDDKDRLKVKPEAKASEASKSSNSEAEAKVSEEEEDKKKNKLETEPTKTEVNSEVCM